MRRMVIGLALLCGIAYGALQGYLWYEVKRAADRFARQVAPFAEVRYGGVYTSLGGTLGLDDITIRPVMTEDEFHIRALRVEAPDLWFYFTGARQMAEGGIPENLALELQGVGLDMDSELFRLLTQMQQMEPAQPSAFPFEQLDALGCGEQDSWGPDDYVRAGLSRINLDLALRMQHDPVAQTMAVSMNVADPALYRLDFSLNLGVSSNRLQDVRTDVMHHGTISYTDHGWYKLRNAHCARLNGGSAEAYVDRHLELLKTRLGVGLPPEAAEAYRGMMLNGGTVRVALQPAPGTSLAGLGLYKPADAMDLLGMTIAINGVKVDGGQIEWLAPESVAAAAPEGAAPTTLSRRPATAMAKAPPSASRYQAVDLARLSLHLHKPIRVTTRDGRVREGVLTAVEGSRIEVTLQHSRGRLAFPVENGDIKRVEVRLQ